MKAIVADERKAELEAAAMHWDSLASEQEQTEPGRARALCYRRTAESLRREAENGIALCACCLLPLGKKCGKGGKS